MTEETITYPYVFKLKRPIEHGNTLITELVLQEPKVKHFEGVDLTSADLPALMKLFGALAGQPPSTIREMAFVDSLRAGELMGKLLGFSPETLTQP